MLLREKYFNYISSRLGTLGYQIELRGKLNLLGLHLHSENFYLHFFNKLFGFNLENINQVKSNVEAIDLVDEQNKIVVQVSATATKSKIEGALEKDLLKDYDGYNFMFISISKDAYSLRDKEYKNPHNIIFDPENDIYDIQSILNHVNSEDIESIEGIYEFIKTELGGEINFRSFDSNLTHIINILAEDDLSNYSPKAKIDAFEIKRKIDRNELDTTEFLVSEYFNFNSKLDIKYDEFDRQGRNKSLSVLHKINRIYMRTVTENADFSADKTFLKVLDDIKKEVLESSNYNDIPIDELDLCVNIITVDAFVRCKIFKDPKDYDYAAS